MQLIQEKELELVVQQDGSSVLAPSGANSRISEDTTVGNDSLFNFPAAAATSGIGILEKLDQLF